MSRNAVLWFRVLHYAASLELTVEPVTKRWLVTHQAYQEHAAHFTAIFFRPHAAYLDVLR
jgi:hypothetical protein